MSSADGFGSPNAASSHPPIRSSAARTDTLLVETLMHLLIEKGLLTKNDALSVVQTVAQVQRGTLQERASTGAATEPDIQMLRRMFDSFELMQDRQGGIKAEGDNVYPLRPPVHGDHPEFPDAG